MLTRCFELSHLQKNYFKMRLQNKVIIVTGSTTGIGRAIALRCAAEGASVIIHGLEESWGTTLVTEIGQDKAVLHIEDITNKDCPDSLVAFAVKSFGKLDAVVNNAAMIVSSNIHTTDLGFLRRVIEVNTIAPFALIKAALPYLAKQKGKNAYAIYAADWKNELPEG